jgi:hypothetical protein
MAKVIATMSHSFSIAPVEQCGLVIYRNTMLKCSLYHTPTHALYHTPLVLNSQVRFVQHASLSIVFDLHPSPIYSVKS